MSDKSVQVALRVRPLVPNELAKACKDALEVYSDINQVRIKGTDRAFTYNHVFDTTSSQPEIYSKCVEQIIDRYFKGYNVTVLAYGQTGSGKTHTMGTTYDGVGEMGIIPRAVLDIFTRVRDDFSHTITLTVSFMELYQETLYDLLSDKPRDQCVLDIREDPNKGIYIPGLTHIPVHSVQDVFEKLALGSSSRATSATNMNAQSSRSHAIFTMNMVMQNKSDGSETTAKFHLVDLAGSERPKKTGAVGTTFKEGVNINKGLLVLGNVISALGDEKHQNGYIPYRDSNLTRLLKDSLGGNSITLMIACVSPADYNVEETLSTLRYADRARKIQNKPIVNQDPKAAEINLLKKTIQQLRLQIVGQGGPLLGSEEITGIKEENLRLQTRIRDLTLQLSNTFNTNTSLLEKIMILQNTNETLHKKIKELRSEYDVTVDNINMSLNQNDAEAVKSHLVKLQSIKEQFVGIDAEQKRAENEILTHEQTVDLHSSQDNLCKEIDLSKDQEHFTNKQMALNVELQELTKNLAIKEHLARQITTNTQHLVDYNAMAENEEKILTLQKEKHELMQKLKNAHGGNSKNSETTKKKIHELEGQIQDLNKKVQEQARLIKLKAKDVDKINVLNKEILQMKQTRVKLIKKMREESERFRTWKMQRERELAKLKQEDRKKQNQIVKMEAIHSKQQNVLKRKVEEAVALNKRLKDALALRKAAHDMKNGGKTEKIGHWIKQEVDVQMHLIEAEVTLRGLVEDRATLQQQLDKLKEDPSDQNESQIRNIEEDIELRSVQIQDLQQKILDSDEENKKSKLDNIQTMGDAKFALHTLLEETREIKRREVKAKNKLIDVQANQTDLNQKVAAMEKVVKLMEHKHEEDVSLVQKDYEEKIAVLLRQLRGIEMKGADEELQQRCAIQAENIERLDQEKQNLEEENRNLKEKLDAITHMAQESQRSDDIDDVKTPVQQMKRIKVKKEGSTFILDNKENLNSSLEEFDDISRDPDWKKTPIGKWLLEKRKRTANKSLDDEPVPIKRTSEGGCMCVKSNCSKRCGCRKGNRSCTKSCKCSSSCVNKEDGTDSESFSKPVVEEKRKRTLTDSSSF